MHNLKKNFSLDFSKRSRRKMESNNNNAVAISGGLTKDNANLVENTLVLPGNHDDLVKLAEQIQKVRTHQILLSKISASKLKINILFCRD